MGDGERSSAKESSDLMGVDPAGPGCKGTWIGHKGRFRSGTCAVWCRISLSFLLGLEDGCFGNPHLTTPPEEAFKYQSYEFCSSLPSNDTVSAARERREGRVISDPAFLHQLVRSLQFICSSHSQGALNDCWVHLLLAVRYEEKLGFVEFSHCQPVLSLAIDSTVSLYSGGLAGI